MTAFTKELSLRPISFFSCATDVHYLEPGKALDKRHRLPHPTAFLGQKPFAQLSLGWNEHGIRCNATITGPFHKAHHPNYREGDAIELYIDTRDIKSARITHRFCHHFFFLPEEVKGVQCGEVTSFRTDDAHPLCDATKLHVESTLKGGKAVVDMIIPASCLHGYDPDQIPRLGFSYTIRRQWRKPQDFALSCQEYPVEQLPGLWASLNLLQPDA